MAFKLRHLFLLVGILTIILSFLFFGRATSTYDVIILSGLSLSTIAYLIILFKDNRQSKLIWTLVVFAGIGLQWLTEPSMIRLSYLYYVKQNEQEFSKVNKIILAKTTNTIWVGDSRLWKRHGLSTDEGLAIRNAVRDKQVSFIEKDSIKIYYRTFGMLDVSHGLFYFYSSSKPDSRYKHLTGNWYH